MVIHNCFQDVFNLIPQNVPLSLPISKQKLLEISYDSNLDKETVYNGAAPILPFANSDSFHTSIVDWRRLTAESDDCKAVYEISFDVERSGFEFKAGDTIGVIPHNDEITVNAIIEHLDLTSQADVPYVLKVDPKNKVPGHVPVQSTLRHVLTHCVDFRCVFKKVFLLILSQHTKDENERIILEYLCSKEGSNSYQTHILNSHISLLDLFNIFKSCKPPIQVLLANLPRLLPRPYSIVNSGLKNNKILKICFSVIRLDNHQKGLTTGWLENIILNNNFNLEQRMDNLKLTNDCDSYSYSISIYLRKNMSGFLLPSILENPLILVGPGTGVSPYIGFLEERDILIKKDQSLKLGDAWLFFGCRNPKLDFIYEKELNEFLSNGVLTKLCTAFSRIEDTDSKYVQDAMLRNSENITKLIESNASIYVCGDGKNMATQVKDTFIQCLVKAGKTEDEAKNIITEMQKEKRYFIDSWS